MSFGSGSCCSSVSPAYAKHPLSSGARAGRSALCILLVSSAGITTSAQVLSRRPPADPNPTASTPAIVATPSPVSIPLTVQAGTPIKVTLDREIRVQQVGQPVHGKVAEPVYAFDKLLIPAGAEAFGKISAIEGVSKKQRTLSALNADFSPRHHVSVTFSEFVLPGGQHRAAQTTVSPAPDGTLKFVSADHKGSNAQGNAAKQRASHQVANARAGLKDKWANMKKEMEAPGKMHRLERFVLTESPYRPQYLDPGTAFDASLKTPLDFGTEQLRPGALSEVGTQPPSGSVVYARLTTPLTSATAKRGDLVDAVITAPVIASDHLFFPEGSHLRGTVLQARPGRWLSHSGQLRITFHQIVPPNGMPQEVQTSLQGVSVSGADHLALDAEGGAQVAQPKSRYLTTALQLAIADATALDSDAGKHTATNGGGDIGKGAAAGASGFRLVGAVLGAAAKSRVVSSGLGIYGASIAVYSHFLARGREVIYPRDMSMVIELGNPDSKTDTRQAR